jgi:hypothetical protein
MVHDRNAWHMTRWQKVMHTTAHNDHMAKGGGGSTGGKGSAKT